MHVTVVPEAVREAFSKNMARQLCEALGLEEIFLTNETRA